MNAPNRHGDGGKWLGPDVRLEHTRLPQAIHRQPADRAKGSVLSRGVNSHCAAARIFLEIDRTWMTRIRTAISLAFPGLQVYFPQRSFVTVRYVKEDQVMKRLGHKLLCWAGLLLGIIVVPSTVHANSITIMSTFGPNHLSDPTGGSLITNGPGLASITSAMPFTPTTLSTLYQIDIAVAYDTTDRSNAFSLALMTDNFGQPGSILESWSLTISFPILGCSHCFETVFSTQHPILQRNTGWWPSPAKTFMDSGNLVP